MYIHNYVVEFYMKEPEETGESCGVWILREDDPFETGETSVWIDLEAWQRIVEEYIGVLHGREED